MPSFRIVVFCKEVLYWSVLLWPPFHPIFNWHNTSVGRYYITRRNIRRSQSRDSEVFDSHADWSARTVTSNHTDNSLSKRTLCDEDQNLMNILTGVQDKNNKKWFQANVEVLRQQPSCAENICKNFTIPEMKIVLYHNTSANVRFWSTQCPASMEMTLNYR